MQIDFISKRLTSNYVLFYGVEPNVLEMLRSRKTCFTFWKNAQDIFANYIECLFETTPKSNFSQTDQP